MDKEAEGTDRGRDWGGPKEMGVEKGRVTVGVCVRGGLSEVK